MENKSGFFAGLFIFFGKKIELTQFELSIRIVWIEINSSGKFRKCLSRLGGLKISQGKLIMCSGKFWFSLNSVFVFDDGLLEFLLFKVGISALHVPGPDLGRIPATGQNQEYRKQQDKCLQQTASKKSHANLHSGNYKDLGIEGLRNLGIKTSRIPSIPKSLNYPLLYYNYSELNTFVNSDLLGKNRDF